MKHRLLFLLVLFSSFAVFLLCAVRASAQSSSGILDPSRAIDWSKAGVVGGIPSGSWANCVTTQCNTVNSGTVTAASLQAAINSAPNSTIIQIPSGSFSISSVIIMKSNVVLRGAGANRTTLTFTNGAFGGGCFYGGAAICFTADGSTYNNSSNSALNGPNSSTWTAGFAQGATSITLTNVGSAGILNGQYIYLDQANDTAPLGNLFNCDIVTTCAIEGSSGGNVINGVGHAQVQIVKVTAGCSTECTGAGPFSLTITPGLYGTNWAATKTPMAWFPSASVVYAGVENLTVDNQTGMGDNGSTINLFNAFNCWVSGVALLHGGRAHIWIMDGAHNSVQNNYFYQTQDAQSQSYGLEVDIATDNLVVNNIMQQVTAPLMGGNQFGNSFAYNYMINDFQTASANCMYLITMAHDAAAEYNLYEGNFGEGNDLDDVHGSSGLNTMFRNVFTGYELGKSCTTIGIIIDPYNRDENVVGNVLGTPGITIGYDDFSNPSQAAQENSMVYILNQPHGSMSADSVVAKTLLRWGNYDNVTGAVRWCGNSSDTGWSTKCGNSSEVPTTSASPYNNAVPSKGDTGIGQSAMPASFIYASTPSWWPSGKPWPAIGPDVTNGSMGQCSGGTYAGLMATAAGQCTGGTLSAQVDAGHAYSIPAMDCYFSLGGPPDGSGSALSFNASQCYASSGTSGSGPAPPTGLAAAVN